MQFPLTRGAAGHDHDIVRSEHRLGAQFDQGVPDQEGWDYLSECEYV